MTILSALIDQREPSWCQSLTFGGVPTSVELLDAGDVLAICADGAVIGVERKTASDLLNTLRADRLFPQVAKLRELTPWAYLIVCGALMPAGDKTYIGGVETGWSWSAVQGALLTVQDCGVKVLTVPSDADFETAIVRLCRRDRTSVRIDQPREVNVLPDDVSLLARLPGIGPERAQQLIDYTGTAAWAMQFLSDPSFNGSLKGFGPETKRKVRETLGLNAAEALCVIDPAGIPLAGKEKEKAGV